MMVEFEDHCERNRTDLLAYLDRSEKAMAKRNEAQLESEELARAEKQMQNRLLAIPARYHGINLLLAPCYEVRLHPGEQGIGMVYKVGVNRFYAVPANHQEMCYENASLELVIAWLYGKQGVGIDVEEQRKTLAKVEGQRAFFKSVPCPSCGNGALRGKCEVCHFTGFVQGGDPEGNAADTL